MDGFGVGEEGDEPEREEGVTPPDGGVRRLGRRRGDTRGPPGERQRVADETHRLEVGEAGAEDTHALDDVAADAEGEEREDEGVVFQIRVFPPQSRVADAVAPPDGHADADDEQQPHRVHHQRVREVEVADEKRVPTQQLGPDVHVDREDRRPDQEGEKAPDDEGVHDAGVDVAVELCFVGEQEADGASDAAGQVVEAVERVGRRRRVRRDAGVDAVAEDEDGDGRQVVEGGFADGADGPERLPRDRLEDGHT